MYLSFITIRGGIDGCSIVFCWSRDDNCRGEGGGVDYDGSDVAEHASVRNNLLLCGDDNAYNATSAMHSSIDKSHHLLSQNIME